MKKPNNQEKNQSEKDKKHFSKLIGMPFRNPGSTYSSKRSSKGPAFGAQPLDEVVDFPRLESGRIAHGGDVFAGQAERLPARLAMEVAVQLAEAAGVVVATHAVLRRTAAVLDDMQQVALREEHERAEYRRLVDPVGRLLQIGQAERPFETLRRLQHEHPHRRGIIQAMQTSNIL